MKRVLVTGASGFVGKHLLRFLQQKKDIMIWGTSFRNSPSDYAKVKWEKVNLLNEFDIQEMIVKVRPDIVFHLAGQSNVKRSWEDKAETFRTNVMGTIHLLEAVRQYSLEAKVVTVGSSEEYGIVADDCMPIQESYPCTPTNPYGVSKLSVGLLAQQYYKSYGLKCIHARPFNHIGPGQAVGFVTTDFAKQIVSIEMGIQENPIQVGNLNAKRDFTDVRDIVRAYWLLALYGKAGEIYNVASGRGISISEIVNELIIRSTTEIKVEQDPSKFRPIDIPLYIGDQSKITRDCSWSPEIPLSQTFDEIINDWRERLFL